MNVYFCLSLKTKKRGLCAYDDKRFLLADGIHTLAYGHHDVPAVVRAVEGSDTTGPADRVLAAADARNGFIPVQQRTFPPIGREPAACFREARRLMHASSAAPHTSFPPFSAAGPSTSRAITLQPPTAAAAAQPTTSSNTRHFSSADELLAFLSDDTI